MSKKLAKMSNFFTKMAKFWILFGKNWSKSSKFWHIIDQNQLNFIDLVRSKHCMQFQALNTSFLDFIAQNALWRLLGPLTNLKILNFVLKFEKKHNLCMTCASSEICFGQLLPTRISFFRDILVSRDSGTNQEISRDPGISRIRLYLYYILLSIVQYNSTIVHFHTENVT